MRIAVIADIHGNILALDAVLDHLRAHQPDIVVDLGDRASGPLWPRETIARLDTLKALAVRGNCDRAVGISDPQSLGASDRFAYDQLDAGERRRLGALPASIEIAKGILAVHGTPTDDEIALLDTVADGHVLRDGLAGIASRLDAVDARIVLCGHSHRPDALQLPAGPLIVNPGSVGLPAYEMPGYVSESGSPHARYALIDVRPHGPVVQLISIPYDHEAAALRADANGRPDLAYGLRFGTMPSSRPPLP